MAARSIFFEFKNCRWVTQQHNWKLENSIRVVWMTFIVARVNKQKATKAMTTHFWYGSKINYSVIYIARCTRHRTIIIRKVICQPTPQTYANSVCEWWIVIDAVSALTFWMVAFSLTAYCLVYTCIHRVQCMYARTFWTCKGNVAASLIDCQAIRSWTNNVTKLNRSYRLLNVIDFCSRSWLCFSQWECQH